MITPVRTRSQFNELFEKEGWPKGTINPSYLMCPFDADIRLCLDSGTFFKGALYCPDYEVVVKITNIKDGRWEYDDQTGLISNGLVAVRVK